MPSLTTKIHATTYVRTVLCSTSVLLYLCSTTYLITYKRSRVVGNVVCGVISSRAFYVVPPLPVAYINDHICCMALTTNSQLSITPRRINWPEHVGVTLTLCTLTWRGTTRDNRLYNNTYYSILHHKAYCSTTWKLARHLEMGFSWWNLSVWSWPWRYLTENIVRFYLSNAFNVNKVDIYFSGLTCAAVNWLTWIPLSFPWTIRDRI